MYYKIKAAIKPLIKDKSLYSKVKSEIKKTLSENKRVALGFNASRIWKYFKDKDFGIISAFKSELSPEVNKEKQSELKKDVKALGYGYKEIKGVYRYEDGSLVDEYALFIPQVKKEDILTLGKKYQQESVLYADRETDKIVVDFYGAKQPRVYDKLEYGFKDAWENWSEYKDLRFSFSSVEWKMPVPPTVNSWGRSMYLKAYMRDNEIEDYNETYMVTEENDDWEG